MSNRITTLHRKNITDMFFKYHCRRAYFFDWVIYILAEIHAHQHINICIWMSKTGNTKRKWEKKTGKISPDTLQPKTKDNVQHTIYYTVMVLLIYLNTDKPYLQQPNTKANEPATHAYIREKYPTISHFCPSQ